jgi:hypothetical protein
MISVATDMHVLPAGVMDSLNKAKGLGHGSKLTGVSMKFFLSLNTVPSTTSLHSVY